MKAIESFSVSESFGLKDLSLEEIENINGGESVSIGQCSNVATYLGPDVHVPPLTGSVISLTPIPIDIGPVVPISSGSSCGGGNSGTSTCSGGSSSCGSSNCGGGK